MRETASKARILIQDRAGVRPLEEGYASERELQEFLRDYAELIPVQEIDIGTPSLLCVGFEVRDAGNSQDLLYVDENALLTIVETKLKRNRESRREVLAQILEYAAYAQEWSIADVQERASRFLLGPDCPQKYRGQTLEAVVIDFLRATDSHALESFSYDEFLESVRTNLENGRIRLVVAIDELPEQLLKTAEFINRFSEHFDVYLFQLKRFRDATSQANIFVPMLFGRVPNPPSSKTQRNRWVEETFLQDARGKRRAAELNIILRLLELGKNQAFVNYGGGKNASFHLRVVGPDSTDVCLLKVSTHFGIELDFGELMQKGVPESVRLAWAERLQAIPSVKLPLGVATTPGKYPMVTFDALMNEHELASFEESVLWAITEVGNYLANAGKPTE